METQVFNQENYYSKELIETNGLRYIKDSPYYMFYAKKEFLYIFDATSDLKTMGHKLHAIVEDRYLELLAFFE